MFRLSSAISAVNSENRKIALNTTRHAMSCFTINTIAERVAKHLEVYGGIIQFLEVDGWTA